MSRRHHEYPDGVRIIDLGREDIEYSGGPGTRLPPTRYEDAAAPRQIQGPAPFHVRPAGEVRPAHSLCIARRPDSVAAQQYRLLKYKLKDTTDPRVIGLTSPITGEGKTTVAANLGLALAEGRRVRVLMLDLNLRDPALMEMFGVSSGVPVAEQLRRKRRDPEAYWDVLELGSRLHLMGGGGALDNPAPLLNSDELPRLISDAAEHYDYVVVDLPAVLTGADAKIVQEQLDGVVLVCRAGLTTKAKLQEAMQQLGAHKCQGALMLDVMPRYVPG